MPSLIESCCACFVLQPALTRRVVRTSDGVSDRAMDIALPADVAQQLKALQQALAELQDKLSPCVSSDSLGKAAALERAELNVTTAEAIHSLFCLYLRAHGASPDDHAVVKEKERIDLFKHKVSKVSSEAILRRSQRTTEVNVQAANRFITAAIPELSKEQKQALYQAGTKRKASAETQRSSQSKPVQDQALQFLQETMRDLNQTRQ